MTDAPLGFGGIDEAGYLVILQSAGLNAEEKQDILSATMGSLEFNVVSKALQTLWDEQFLGRVSTSSRSPSAIHCTHARLSELVGLSATMDTGLNKMMVGME